MMKKLALLGAMALALMPFTATVADAMKMNRGFGGGFNRPFNPPGVGGNRPFIQDRPMQHQAPRFQFGGPRGQLMPHFNGPAAAPAQRNFTNDFNRAARP